MSYNGTLNVPSLIANSAAPLDVRTVVDSIDNLTDNSITNLYTGIVVNVKGTGDLYVLTKHPRQAGQLESWVKIGAVDLSEYIKAGDLPDFLTGSDLEEYVKVEDLEGYVKPEDLAELASKSDLEGYVKTEDAVDYLTSSDLYDYLKVSELPTNVSEFINDAGYLVENDLNDYAKTEDLEDYAKAEDLDDYAKAEDLEDLATKEEMVERIGIVGREVESDVYEYIYDKTSWEASYNNGVLKEYYTKYPNEDLWNFDTNSAPGFNDKIYTCEVYTDAECEGEYIVKQYHAQWYSDNGVQRIYDVEDPLVDYYLPTFFDTPTQIFELFAGAEGGYVATPEDLVYPVGKWIKVKEVNFGGPNVRPAWEAAVQAPGAQFPWIALKVENVSNQIVKFEYEGKTPVYPWGENRFGLGGKAWGIASVAKEWEENGFLIQENANNGDESWSNDENGFDIDKFKLVLVTPSSVKDYVDAAVAGIDVPDGFEIIDFEGENRGVLTDEQLEKLMGNKCVVRYQNRIYHKAYTSSNGFDYVYAGQILANDDVTYYYFTVTNIENKGYTFGTTVDARPRVVGNPSNLNNATPLTGLTIGFDKYYIPEVSTGSFPADSDLEDSDAPEDGFATVQDVMDYVNALLEKKKIEEDSIRYAYINGYGLNDTPTDITLFHKYLLNETGDTELELYASEELSVWDPASYDDLPSYKFTVDIPDGYEITGAYIWNVIRNSYEDIQGINDSRRFETNTRYATREIDGITYNSYVRGPASDTTARNATQYKIIITKL